MESLKKVRSSDDIKSALLYGTTLTSRFWLGLAGLMYGLGLFAQQKSWLAHPNFRSLLEIAPLPVWAAAFTVIGIFGIWRALARHSAPYWAWTINTLVVIVWGTAVCIRLWGIGPVSLLSVQTVFLLMALWCQLRTEATARDKETA